MHGPGWGHRRWRTWACRRQRSGTAWWRRADHHSHVAPGSTWASGTTPWSSSATSTQVQISFMEKFLVEKFFGGLTPRWKKGRPCGVVILDVVVVVVEDHPRHTHRYIQNSSDFHVRHWCCGLRSLSSVSARWPLLWGRTATQLMQIWPRDWDGAIDS